MQLITDPGAIERRSFELIAEELAGKTISEDNAFVVKRVIHTTADFDYADNLFFSPSVSTMAVELFRQGAHIVTDTKMALAGISKPALTQLGCDANCFIDAPEVMAAAKTAGSTRASAAVDHAVTTLSDPLVFVIGNAPTALIRIYELIQAGQLAPALVIGVPVGFVNVVESKELLLQLDVPSIVARGRKGGSNVAAAIINALLYEATGRVA